MHWLRWIENHQQDREFGEWYWGIGPDGALDPGRGDHKGSAWKASYHQIRGLLYGVKWLDELSTEQHATATSNLRIEPGTNVGQATTLAIGSPRGG